MEPNETFPSLIKCLDTGEHGFYLDLWPSFESPDGAEPASVDSGPFSKRISAHVKTGGEGTVAPVLLVVQRDSYDPIHSPAPINNHRIEKAWQNAWHFYGSSNLSKKPIVLKDQVNPAGELRAFAPLFYCRHTRQWFHPVCPQCGTALTLCRDDGLLNKRGLPGYSDSLWRFLHCESCSKLSDSAPFFTLQKKAGLPDSVHDKDELILQWEQLLGRLSEDVDLPCGRCPERNGCYATEGLVTGRIVPFSFFPFFFLVLPAPTIGAFDFLRAVSGDAAVALPEQTSASPATKRDRFFFQSEDRRLFEILYLKLTFLQQVVDQIVPVGNSEKIQEFDFSLNSIAVDWIPSGAGLPAYWNFTVRMIDSVGSFQSSPFAPAMPEGQYLHFLGALWFHTLLVNSHQGAEAVLAAVGNFLNQTDSSGEREALAAEMALPESPFLGRQIHWNSKGKSLPQNWDEYWRPALQLGFQLVRAGTNAGAAWNGTQFCEALTALRERIKSEMFSGEPVAAAQPRQSDRLGVILSSILEKWQAQADAATDTPPTPLPDVEETAGLASAALVPERPATAEPVPKEKPLHPGPPQPPGQLPEPAGWEGDIEETVILRAGDAMPPPETPPTPIAESQWDDDIQETVVLQGGAVQPPPLAAAPDDEGDQTIVITPASKGSPAPPAHPDTDLDATVVINAGAQTPPGIAAPTSDEDLEATLIQGAGGGASPPDPTSGATGGPPISDFASDSDLEATIVIQPNRQTAAAPRSQDDDEDLEATLIETPRRSDRPAGPIPSAQPAPPQPPQETLGANGPAPPATDSENTGADDDDIMEQTFIIRSETKKE